MGEIEYWSVKGRVSAVLAIRAVGVASSSTKGGTAMFVTAGSSASPQELVHSLIDTPRI
jgi:hypothetical protein